MLIVQGEVVQGASFPRYAVERQLRDLIIKKEWLQPFAAAALGSCAVVKGEQAHSNCMRPPLWA